MNMIKKQIGLILLLLVIGQNVARAESFDMDKCLDIIKQAESSGRDSCIGDGSKSRGAYQISEDTWKRYSKLNWDKYAHEPVESRLVASLIVSDIVRGLRKRGVAVTYGAICAWYNCGHYKDVKKWNTKNKVYQGTYK